MSLKGTRGEAGAGPEERAGEIRSNAARHYLHLRDRRAVPRLDEGGCGPCSGTAPPGRGSAARPRGSFLAFRLAVAGAPALPSRGKRPQGPTGTRGRSRMGSLGCAARGLASLLCVLLLACATADVMHLEQQPRAPMRLSDVRVLLDEPSQPYKAIAIVEASDQGWGLGLDALKTKMVEEAAALGGDAVILGQRSNQSGGTYFMPIGSAVYGIDIPVKKLAGKVIVFTNQVAPRPAEPRPRSVPPVPQPSSAPIPQRQDAAAMAGPSVTALMSDLGSADQRRRSIASELLVQRGDSVVPDLRNALASPDPQIRGRAAWVLGSINTVEAQQAAPELRRLVADADQFVRDKAAEALLKMGFSLPIGP